MSWNWYDAPCPVCWEDMDVYEDRKPYPTCSCWCYHCWFVSTNVVDRMTIDEVNDYLEDNEQEPITKDQYNKYGDDFLFSDLKKKWNTKW